MQTNLEQLKAIVSNLSPEEFKKFVEWYESVRQKKLNGKEKDSPSKDEQADKAGSTG